MVTPAMNYACQTRPPLHWCTLQPNNIWCEFHHRLTTKNFGYLALLQKSAWDLNHKLSSTATLASMKTVMRIYFTLKIFFYHLVIIPMQLQIKCVWPKTADLAVSNTHEYVMVVSSRPGNPVCEKPLVTSIY